ncbi:methylated-DNA--[protein]-cysteine S-methyltransferase [Pseudooceanicola sp. C21-150M6]|uniref:methylated-DNA--[protein]-cysteine S-methyltransferase n=1 Tax=Pseudooceanicola sp. C21-150M6 TaxID=3434355 RepID=UPI003D7F35F5
MLQHDVEQGYHYHVIRRAIEEIDAAEVPLTLEELSRRMGMSQAHFQRLFSAWTGVSPKRFQQYLALGHAKALLSERFTMLETAAGAGLSGGGRLHDLFLRWEAMSPGDYARGGAGLVIRWGWLESPFGPALVMATDRGICGIGFSDELGPEQVWSDLTGRWPEAQFVEDAKAVTPWAEAAFGGQGEARIHMLGAPFQIKVWEALLRIPSGHVTTYGEVARAIGSPGASRAVGTAIGRNPVSWLIPCHRAIRATGGVGEYHWGQPVKRAMLAWEAARADA